MPQPAPIQSGQVVSLRSLPATVIESDAWQRWTTFAAGPLRSNVAAMLAAAEAAANAQLWFENNGLNAHVWTPDHQQAVKQILDKHNTINRLIARADAGKYLASLKDGDITIFAPVGMDRESYDADRYPGFGAFWVPVIIGVVLIASAYALTIALDSNAKSEKNDLVKGLIKTSAAMADKSKDRRDSFVQMLRANADILEQSQTGLLDKLVSSAGGRSLAGGLGFAAGGAALALFLFWAFTSKKTR